MLFRASAAAGGLASAAPAFYLRVEQTLDATVVVEAAAGEAAGADAVAARLDAAFAAWADDARAAMLANASSAFAFGLKGERLAWTELYCAATRFFAYCGGGAETRVGTVRVATAKGVVGADDCAAFFRALLAADVGGPGPRIVRGPWPWSADVSYDAPNALHARPRGDSDALRARRGVRQGRVRQGMSPLGDADRPRDGSQAKTPRPRRGSDVDEIHARLKNEWRDAQVKARYEDRRRSSVGRPPDAAKAAARPSDVCTKTWQGGGPVSPRSPRLAGG